MFYFTKGGAKKMSTNVQVYFSFEDEEKKRKRQSKMWVLQGNNRLKKSNAMIWVVP